MFDYLSQHLWQMWAVIAVLCLILELTAGDFFILCFSIGAAFAATSAAFGCGFYVQLLVFAIFTLLSLFLVRPVALRYLHKNEPNKPSNADALIGRTGRVTEQIPADGTGYVQIDGDLWKALSNTSIPVGSTVRVIARESTIITVEKL